MKRIESPYELSEWLKGKPTSWAQIVATRVALRVLPWGIRFANLAETRSVALALFRASAISWGARNYPAHNMGIAAVNAAITANTLPKDSAADAIAYAVEAADDDAVAELFAAKAFAHAIDAAMNAAADSALLDALLSAITRDCEWLSNQSDEVHASRTLANRSLWLGQPPAEWTRDWRKADEKVRQAEPTFEVWLDWYERRIWGEHTAFDIPGDKGRREDKWLLRQIADAADEDFWERGAKYVNRQLASWLDQARQRAVQEQDSKEKLQEIIDELLTSQPLAIPVQSDRALRFARDPEGKITLSPDTDLTELRNDQDARERHLLAVEDAKLLLAACVGRNSAERLTAILTAYVAAAGESVETMRPSLFVQKGERLRQELARYEGDDTDLPPLPDSILLDLKSVCKAHNMVVGLDPALLVRDTAQLPPDAVTGDVTPAEVRDFVHGADEAGILQSDVPDIMEEAVALVPPGADATDRRFRWCVESCRNLVIEAFAVTLNRPAKVASTVTAVAMLGPGLLVGNALNTAKFLLETRTWIEERLGRHAPTWNALFVDLCDRLEKDTPLGVTVKKS